MHKLDPKFTRRVADWLDTPPESQNVAEGAELLLAMSRNRALYNSIMRRPVDLKPKLVYELRKYLAIRNRNMTLPDVARHEQMVMSRVADTVACPAIDVDDELPAGTVARGRRPDHDSLPQEIQTLWDDNGERYRRIVILFNELKNMADKQPCDRAEKVWQLGKLDEQYRASLAAYDAYSPDAPATVTDADAARKIAAARKSISKYRKVLVETSPDPARRAECLARIQSSVDVILSMGAGVSDSSRADLVAMGIKF